VIMVLPPRTGMPLHFGITITSAEKDKIVGEMQADERHLNAFGILHGGALMAFGDELRGLGSRFHIPPGTRTATIESKTNFFRLLLTGPGDGRVGAIACRAAHAGLADFDLWSRRRAGRPRDADPARVARGAGRADRVTLWVNR
jgi:uncharacterized protein (TIGR00369 family)